MMQYALRKIRVVCRLKVPSNEKTKDGKHWKNESPSLAGHHGLGIVGRFIDPENANTEAAVDGLAIVEFSVDWNSQMDVSQGCTRLLERYAFAEKADE